MAPTLPKRVRQALLIGAVIWLPLIILWHDYGIKLWHFLPTPLNRWFWKAHWIWENAYALCFVIYIGTEDRNSDAPR